MAAKKGRPPSWTEDEKKAIQLRICAEMATGKSLRSICNVPGMPSLFPVFQWLAADPIFAELYARARSQQMIALGEELLEIADDDAGDTTEVTTAKGATYTQSNHAAVQRAKLKVDTRKWLMSHLMPHVYGEGRAAEKKDDDGELKVVVEGGLPDVDG